MARKIFKKKAPVEKAETIVETPLPEEPVVEKAVEKKAETTKKAISVDAMVEENLAAVVSSDYQKYLRKLMKEASGRF